MESSRGGPLTTFIMMLPLIVVPTIAMLRPAGQGQSMLTDLLSAASGNGGNSESVDPGAQVSADEALEDLFGDSVDSMEPPPADSLPNDLARNDVLNSDASSIASSDLGTVGAVQDTVSAPDSGQGVQQLKQLGVTKLLWYSPAPGVQVCVVFVPAGRGMVSYRFSAQGGSREEALADVVSQVRQWQSTRAR